MRFLLCCCGVLTLFLLPGSAPSQEKKDPYAYLRRLEKIIADVRGLPFKEPVKARIISRTKDVDPVSQGYYDIEAKTLFLYDDIKDNYKKGVLIHEMVHALQDQHFDLGKRKLKLHQQGYAKDADLAWTALVEGDATFTMIEVLKEEQPQVAAMLKAPLEKAKHLHNAFVYAQGAKYVQALKDKGGWPKVNAAYKFPPQSTASIFNLAGVSVVDLGPGKTEGAFALWKKCHADPRALRIARAWRGERLLESDHGSVQTFALRDAEHAQLLAELLLAQDAKAVVEVLGSRVYVYAASDAKSLRALKDRVLGPLRLKIEVTADKKEISFGQLLDRLLDYDLVCIGEDHDSDLHHRVQLQIIKGLFARDERLGVGMEMFQKPLQVALDRFVEGKTDEAKFLEESDYWARWGYDWSLYQPIVDFCKRNGVSVCALNAPKELTGSISKKGYAGLTDAEKKQLGAIDFHVKEHRAYWFELLAKMHGNKKATNDEKERSYQVMTVWDGFMAQSAAHFMKERRLRRLVVLAGSGHIERGFGIPNRAAQLSGGRAATIGIRIDGHGEQQAPITDYILRVR